jgi:hypothetical protein
MSVVRHQSMVLVLMQLSNLNSGGAQPNRMTYTNPAKVGKVGRLGTLSLTRAFPFTSMNNIATVSSCTTDDYSLLDENQTAK